MDDGRLGRLLRALRHDRDWRQIDLAARARITREAVSAIERGRASDLRLGQVRRAVGALGCSLDISIRGLGAEPERLLDERHARLLGATAKWLSGSGWQVEMEVSYSEWGERGSIDLFGWHPATATLLVVEVKSELVSVEATLRKHDEKARLASRIAEARLGWRARSVGRLLVLPEDRTQRRRVVASRDVLDLAYPARNVAARRWRLRPSGRSFSGLVFLPDVAPVRAMGRSGRRERVRRRRPRAL